MQMNGMYKEDEYNQKRASYLVEVGKLKDEADIVLVGNADVPHQLYSVTKPEDGYEGQVVVANPYEFAQANADKKVLVIHGDGSFDRYLLTETVMSDESESDNLLNPETPEELTDTEPENPNPEPEIPVEPETPVEPDPVDNGELENGNDGE